MANNAYDLIVIGGGAAGMMGAVAAAQTGKRVLLLEKNNRLGKKILITGKGRCNVTNNCNLETFMKNVTTNGRFLYSAFSQFSAEDAMVFFEELGVSLKTERGNRVFPESDKAQDIVSAFENAVKQYGVTVKNATVSALIIEQSQIRGVLCGEVPYRADAVLVATGGKSYPLTGSTGDGYQFARQAGHTVVPQVPSLVPVVAQEKYCADMMGLSLKNVELSLKDVQTGKLLYSELGEMLFTHFGVSGPLVLSASSHIYKMQPDRFMFEIDLKPALSNEKLDARIQRDFAENSNKDFANVLRKLLPAKMVPVVVALSEISGEMKVNQITKMQRMQLVQLLKAFPIHIKSFRPIEEAIITSGGVAVSEISPKTMESKLIKGLRFAGEVLDVDAYTGGFNLQIAFSTGYAAGKNL